MQPLAAAHLLDLRDRGHGLPPVWRALLLLEAAYPEEPLERLAALPIGERDARLLRLRARTFGPVLDSETACPACGERLEFGLRSEALQAESALPAAPGPETRPATHTLRHDGYAVTFRPPNSRDLLDAAEAAAPETAAPGAAERDLLARCVVEAQRDGEPVLAEALPEPVAAAVAAAMAEADPRADFRLALTCPACDHRWREPFDIAAFFWAEVEAWAPRLLREVHLLAAAYGWREADILKMSAWRRRQYLDLATA